MPEGKEPISDRTDSEAVCNLQVLLHTYLKIHCPR